MFAKLTSRLPELIASAEERTGTAIEKAAARIEMGCKARSRVDTGNMRGGWQQEQHSPTEIEVFNPVEYTIYNEFGTVNMPAQPMLTPSVEEAIPELVADLKNAWPG